MPDKICSHSRETCLQLQLKLIADTWGGGCVKIFALTERRGDSVMSIYINKFVPSGFQNPSDIFSFKFLSLKIRILHVLYMYFCFNHILENLTNSEKFANSLGVPNLITKQRFNSLITGVYLQRLRTRCPTNCN